MKKLILAAFAATTLAGGAQVRTNASVVVTIAKKELGGVQLWENGPYWAECNVGATKPEEYGYYFWWGDTVGYTRSGGKWWPARLYTDVTWVSSTGKKMGKSPFDESKCPTFDKKAQLQSAGYIDSTGKLVAAHDAATAHLDSPWRMPTSDEMQALVNNCTTTWISTNGVTGRLVTGKGAYADRSIFLPAAGNGTGTRLCHPGSYGFYWSSTFETDRGYAAWDLGIYSGNVYHDIQNCFFGVPVRPVR